jgi:c-di-GMP-binding flagellar brake protein YcgR
MDQTSEIIREQNVLQLLRSLTGSGKICKMEIPGTPYGWTTLLLEVRKVGNSYYLLFDPVAEFSKAIAHSQNQALSIEFFEKDGVLLTFQTRVVQSLREAIWAELPDSIYRTQKRAFYRVDALLGSEISFKVNSRSEARGIIKDYSLGGVAFLVEGDLSLSPNDELTEVLLRFPDEGGWVRFESALARVRRFEKNIRGKKLCAVEFLEMSERTQKRLWQHLFKEQRKLLQKIKGG